MDWNMRSQYGQAPADRSRNSQLTTERLKVGQAARHVRAAPLNSTPRRQQQLHCRSLENGLDLTDDSYIDSDSISGAFCDDEADEFDPVVRSRTTRVNDNYGDDMAYTQSLPRTKHRDKYHDSYGTPRLIRRNHNNSHKSVMFSDDSSDISSSVCDDIDDAQTLQKSRQTNLQSATPTVVPPGRRYVKKQNAANISSASSSGTTHRSTLSSYSRLGSQSPSVTRMARSQSPSILKSARSPSPSMLKPGRSPSPSILKPGRSPSPSMLKPGRSPSPSIIKPGRSPSPSILKPARNESPSTVRSTSSQSRAAQLQGAARTSYSSMFRGQTAGTHTSRAAAGDPQSRTQFRDKSGDRSLDSGTYRSREKSQERFVDRARSRERSGDRMLDSSRGRSREKSGERMLYDRNRERMKSGGDAMESSRAKEREKSWDRLLANSRTRGREKCGDRLSTISSRAKAREKSGDRMVGGNRAKSRERLENVNAGRKGSDKWLDDESSWDTAGSYGQNSPISPISHAVLPQPFSSKVRTVAKVTPPDTATNSPRSRQSSEHTPSDKEEDYGIDEEDASELLNVNETKSYSYCEVILHDDDNSGTTRGRSGRRQWSTSGAAISSLKYKMNSMSTPSLYTSMDEQDSVTSPDNLLPSTHQHRSPQNYRSLASHDYESPTHDYRSKSQDYGSCDTLSSPQEYRSLSRNHGSQSQTVREATNTPFRRTPLTRSLRRQQWQQKHAAADDATKKSCPSSLEKLGQSLCKSLSPSAIFNSFDHQFDENKNKVSVVTRTGTPSARAGVRRGSADNVTAKTSLRSVGTVRQQNDTDELRAKTPVVTPSRNSDNVRKVNPVTSQPQGHHTWQTPGDVASDTASSSEDQIAKALPIDPAASNISIPDIMAEGSLLGKNRDKGLAENWILCDDGHPVKEGGRNQTKVPSKPKVVVNRSTSNPLIDSDRPFSPFTPNQKRFAQGQSACDDNNNASSGEKPKDIPSSRLGIALFGSKTLFGSKAMNHGMPQPCDSLSSSEEEADSEQQVVPHIHAHDKAVLNYHAKHTAPPSEQPVQNQRDHVSEAASNYRAKYTAPSGEQPVQHQRSSAGANAVSQRQPRRQTIAAFSAEGDADTTGNKLSPRTRLYGNTAVTSHRETYHNTRTQQHGGEEEAESEQQQVAPHVHDHNETLLNYHNKHVAPPDEQPMQHQRSSVGASVVSQRQPRRQTIAAFPAEGDADTTGKKLSPRTRLYGNTAMTSHRETHRYTRTQQHGEADSSSPREPTQEARLETRRKTLAKSCEQLDSSDSSPTGTGRYQSPRSRGILKHTYVKPKSYAAHNGSGPSWLDSHNRGHLRGTHAKSCEQLDAPQDSWERNGTEDGSNFARSRSFRELQQRSRGSSKSSVNDITSGDQPSAQSYVNSLPRRRSNNQTPGGTLTSGRFRRLTEGGDAYSLSQENIADDVVFAERNPSNKKNKVTKLTNGQSRGEPEFLMYL